MFKVRLRATFEIYTVYDVKPLEVLGEMSAKFLINEKSRRLSARWKYVDAELCEPFEES